VIKVTVKKIPQTRATLEIEMALKPTPNIRAIKIHFIETDGYFTLDYTTWRFNMSIPEDRDSETIVTCKKIESFASV